MKQLALAANEYGVVITSSPAAMPAATQRRCSPDVPDDTAAAYGAPVFSANSSSKRSIVGPSESRPERSTSSTSSSSRSSKYGRASGIVFEDKRVSARLTDGHVRVPASEARRQTSHPENAPALFGSFKPRPARAW